MLFVLFPILSIMKIMKKDPKSYKRKKVVKISVLSLLLLLSFYIGSIFYIFNDLVNETTIGEVEDSEFIAPNVSALENWSFIFNYHLDTYHLPFDYPLSVYWNENFTEVQRYETAGDAGGFTGNFLGVSAFRYAWAKRIGNMSELMAAKAQLIRLLNGTRLLYSVPNGGIGPNYPAILARSIIPKNYSGVPVNHLAPPEVLNFSDVFNGVGEYSDWWYLGYPSIDHQSGMIFGLTMLAQLVCPYEPDIAEFVSLLTQQIVKYFLKQDFLLADGNGRTTGQQLRFGPETSGYWVLSLLKMAQVANPNNSRYRDLYFHFVYERDYLALIYPIIRNGAFHLTNYYSLALQYYIIFGLAFCETDPFLKSVYLDLVERYFQKETSISRNPFFNVCYLAMMEKNDTFIIRDIGDQLMRFGVESEDNRTKVPERGEPTSPIREEQWGRPRVTYWRNFMKNHTFGRIFYGWLEPILLPDDSMILNSPKTTDQYPSEDCIFERNPWLIHEDWGDRTYRQDFDLSFLLPYYMARYFQLFEYLESLPNQGGVI